MLTPAATLRGVGGVALGGSKPNVAAGAGQQSGNTGWHGGMHSRRRVLALASSARVLPNRPRTALATLPPTYPFTHLLGSTAAMSRMASAPLARALNTW